MSIVEKEHEIKIDGRNINFYINKGYNFNIGETVKLKTKELNPLSHEKIIAICEVCGKQSEVEYIRYNRCKKGFVCCAKCNNKRTSGFLFENYGVTNARNLEKSKNKLKKTLRERYNVINISQVKEIKEKVKNTVRKNYNVDNVSQSLKIKNKKEKKSLEKFGTKCVLQAEEIKEKVKKTIKERYGVNNVSQSAEIMDKKFLTGIKAKKYILPSGKIIKYQGYEHYAIKFLLENGYNEEDIIIGNKNIEKQIGKIYFNDNGKTRRYFPDIYIEKENKIFEVKSIYTINLNKELINLKKEAVIKKGINFEFLIFNIKGQLCQPIK